MADTSPLHPRHTARVALARALVKAILHKAEAEVEAEAGMEAGVEVEREAEAEARHGRVLHLQRAHSYALTVLRASTRLLPSSHPNMAAQYVSLGTIALTLHMRVRQATPGKLPTPADVRHDQVAASAFARAYRIFCTCFGEGSPATLGCKRLMMLTHNTTALQGST